MDKAERVAEMLDEALRNNEARPTDERNVLLNSDRTIVAAILRREYGDSDDLNDLRIIDNVAGWAQERLRIIVDMAKDRGLPEFFVQEVSRIRAGIDTVASLRAKRAAKEET